MAVGYSSFEGDTMKKKVLILVSYLLVAVLASVSTLGLESWMKQSEQPKLQQLEELILTRFIGEAEQEQLRDAAAEGMIESLDDRWSYYMSAKDFQTHMETANNAYVGIGITITVEEGTEGFSIMVVNENGPAAEAGLQVGDVIVAVEGTSTIGMEASGARDLVRGKEGTQVQITVLRDGQEQTFSVTRREVKTPVAEYEMLEEGIGLVSIVNFDSRCAEETVAAIETLLDQGAEKLIFDVRNNPGGYAKELVKVLDYLLPEGELFRTVDYAGKENVDMSDADCLDIPMAVLVNGDSYSAAEFFAAAMAEYDAAVVVGEKTSGKGHFQYTYELNDGSAVALSVGKYYTPGGVSLEGVGITPDVEVSITEDQGAMIYYGTLDPREDPQIRAAVEALK